MIGGLRDRRSGSGDLPRRRALREAAREAEAVGMIDLREAEADDELELWRSVRSALVPNERTASVAELARRRQLPAHRVSRCRARGVGQRIEERHRRWRGLAARPAGAPPARRRHGVAPAARAPRRASRPGEVGSMVDDAGSLAFAERFGFAETGRQVEQVRDGRRRRAVAGASRRRRDGLSGRASRAAPPPLPRARAARRSRTCRRRARSRSRLSSGSRSG